MRETKPKPRAVAQARKPIVWQGSKLPLLNVLVPMVQAIEHTCYVEVFGGSACLLLGRDKPPATGEVINDVHSDLVNFYRCVREHGPEMERLMQGTLNSRELFYEWRDHREGLTDVQRACRWWFLNATSFGRGNDSFGVARVGGGGGLTRWAMKRAQLMALYERMDGVSIECLDWERCLKLYDGPGTLFFLDPPYTECDNDAYAPWGDETMGKLAGAIFALKGKWILTTNDSEPIRALFAGCQIKRIERARGINAAAAQSYAELIITKE